MAVSINLTEGAIAMICGKDADTTDVKPVLQVADIRLVNTQQQNSNERYRLLLSDGSHLQQGMLATQKNALVRSGRLQKGSIVQLTQFVVNVIQQRIIIIIIELDVILGKCDQVGEPKQYNASTGSTTTAAAAVPAPATSLQPPLVSSRSPPSLSADKAAVNRPPPSAISSMGNPYSSNHTGYDPQAGSYGHQTPPLRNQRPEIYGQTRPPQQQMYINRGPVAKNEGAPRVVPISALNPYQGRWTIKARVTAKGEIRHYNNARGDGKVFSFDLLDHEGGEIRVTCFNMVADQFFSQIEAGRVYLVSRGSLKPAQKNFNHLNNDYEITLDSSSTVQPCNEDDTLIPKQQFHFRSISELEGVENNSMVDIIGVVTSISPSISIMRKNGLETQKRVLQLRDMSGHSVEVTIWGNMCNQEGERLQRLRDSGGFPVLALKAGRVNEFNGKAVSTISTSQLFIDPEIPEGRRVREWFEREGASGQAVSITRETGGGGSGEGRKTIGQIKEERLGTGEKPEWITVCGTVSFVKADNFCYPACPLMVGERKCSKKVTNNGDGRWRCERCEETVGECEYRYILQMQVQDHTGLTWVTAFQETGEELVGIPARELYFLKYEEQDEGRFAEVVRRLLFTKLLLKLKVKEETFSDEQRVKSTVVKVDRLNFSAHSRHLLTEMTKTKGATQTVNTVESFRGGGVPAAMGSGRAYGGLGDGGYSGGGGFGYGGGRMMNSGGAGECFKCHEMGHWAKDCTRQVGGGGNTGGYL